MKYDFEGQLNFSRGEREVMDKATLLEMIHDAESCQKTSSADDKTGVDYVVTLSGGARVLVDGKARSGGCSRWWKNREPELALERWSVMPTPGKPGKIGWTLNSTTPVSLVLFTFDEADTTCCFLLPFQTLRMAFRRFGEQWWKDPGFKNDTQETTDAQGRVRWRSQAVFVPYFIVVSAMDMVSEGRLLRRSHGSERQLELFDI